MTYINHLIEIISLAYANDILVLAGSGIDLQRKINVLAEYCELNNPRPQEPLFNFFRIPSQSPGA